MVGRGGSGECGNCNSTSREDWRFNAPFSVGTEFANRHEQTQGTVIQTIPA